MQSGQASKIWLALGASAAVSGGIAIVSSLPTGGELLWIGVGLIAVGSLALRKGLPSAYDDSPTTQSEVKKAGKPASWSGIEPELRTPAPRRVRLTVRGMVVVCAWVLVLSVFGVLSHQHFGNIPSPPSKRQLDQVGATAPATVHSTETRSVEGGRTLYFIGYSFMTDSGQSMRVSQSVPPRVFARTAEGDTTEVVYLPLNPELHYLPELTSAVSTQTVLFTGGLLLAAAGFAEAQRRLHRRLAVSGMAVSGCTANVRRRGGVRSYLVNYDVDGKRQALKARERNPDLRNGQSVTVLCNPAIPSRAVIYRLAMYRARA